MGGTMDDPKANTALTLSSLTLGDGSSTNLAFNTDYAGPIISVTGNISISQGAEITLSWRERADSGRRRQLHAHARGRSH